MASNLFINNFLVKDFFQPSNIDTENLVKILDEYGMNYIVSECEDGWLLKIDCASLNLLITKEFSLSGKLNNKPYFLEFEQTTWPSPEEDKDPPYEEDNKVASTTLPKKMEYDSEESGKEKQETKMAESKIVMKTVSVQNVPENMNLNDLELFFQNKRRSDGGEIEGNATRDPHTNFVEITFMKEEVAKRVVERSPLSYKNCSLQVTFKKPLFTDDLTEEENKNIPHQFAQCTILVQGVPKCLPKERVKLYFENPRRAEGGEITDIESDSENGIKITFASPIVARKVFEKQNHMIDSNPVTVSMYIPPKMDERVILVSNIKDDVSSESLRDFLEVKADIIVEKVERKKPGTWLVYSDKIDFEKVKTVCKYQSKTFLSETYPEVRQIPLSYKIMVSNIPADWNQKSLENYFRDPFGRNGVVSSQILPGRRCIITFKDNKSATAMSKIKPDHFDIKLYNDYIDSHETYKDIPLPSPFLRKFLEDQKEVFENELKDCGNPLWSESTGNFIKIMCNGDIEEEEIKKIVDALLAIVYEKQSKIPSAIFEEVKEIIQNDEKTIQVYFDNENFTAHIFSFNKSNVADYQKKINNMVESKSNIKEVIELEAYKINLVFADFISSKAFLKNKVHIETKDGKLVFRGCSTNISMATHAMYKFLSEIHTTPIQLPQKAHYILLKKPVKEYLQKKLKSKKCICAWEVNSEGQVLIHSSQKNGLQTAIDILKESIVDLTFQLTSPMKKIMKEEKWSQFLKALSDRYTDKYHLNVGEDIFSIVTINQEAQLIGDEFENFFDTHITYENTSVLKPGIYRFLKMFCMNSIDRFHQNHSPLKICFKNDQTLHISGSKKASKEANDFLQSLISAIKEKKEIFSHFGFKKFLQTGTANIVLRDISNSLQCIILKNEDINHHNILRKTSSSYEVKYKGSKIMLQLADITELKVDAVVNAANRELKHLGGLSKVIIEKGGQEIQDACDRIMSERHSNMILEGSAYVTTAGKLKCRIIIHAVGPFWQDGKNYETVSLSEAITNSLIKAEKNTCNSIAFPAISTGIFRFPLDKATELIVSNIKEYLKNTPDTNLKSIYLVSLREDVITAFHRQLKAMFEDVTAIPTRSGDTPKQVEVELPAKQVKKVLPAQPLKSRQETPTSKTEIEILLGLLNKTKCDVIVNTTNKAMDLSVGAVSKVLLADAGQELQNECYNHRELTDHDIVVTNGYNLPCKKVFHISLGGWSSSSHHMIKSHVKNCLLKADQMNFSHIAFPAFGTGNLRYPIKEVASEMLDAASEYISSVKTGLQKISFVIYEKNTDIHQAFERAKKKGPTYSDDQSSQLNISKDTTTSDVLLQDDRFNIKGIDLTLLQGNITEQKVDAIIHGTNKQFTLKGAISKELLEKIGHQFTKDCKSKVDEMTSANYAVTNAHSLPATYIVHVNIEGIKNKARSVFELCFEAAEKNQIASLALPPLGTGGLGCSLHYFTKEFLIALKNFAKSSPQNLKTVTLIVFDKEMFVKLFQEFNSSERSNQSFTSSNSGLTGDPLKAKKEVLKPREKNLSDACLFFYANSLDTIEEAKKKINSDYTSDYFLCKDIKDDIIIKLQYEQKLQINRLQAEYEVKIEFKPPKITVSGYKEDVIAVTETIQACLISFTKSLHEIKAAELTQKLVQWSYITNTGGTPILKPYPNDINHKLEEAYGKQKNLRLPSDSKTIVFDWSDPDEMFEYFENDKTRRIKILRKDNTKIDLIPQHWEPMDDKHYLKVELKSGAEYDQVKSTFPKNFTIIKIERIQNKSLYIQYQAQLDKMKETNPKGTRNEIEGLWHGTSENVTEKINKNGFNRSYCGKNATAFGQGVYFAVDPRYSLSSTYSPPNDKGHKHIYKCNVLIGVPCQGNTSLRVLPDNPRNPGTPFDSAVNDLNNPTIHVSFHDANAYPAYLITCQ